jgi:hypothetical protein
MGDEGVKKHIVFPNDILEERVQKFAFGILRHRR